MREAARCQRDEAGKRRKCDMYMRARRDVR